MAAAFFTIALDIIGAPEKTALAREADCRDTGHNIGHARSHGKSGAL